MKIIFKRSKYYPGEWESGLDYINHKGESYFSRFGGSFFWCVKGLFRGLRKAI
jgi:hypothetical protein